MQAAHHHAAKGQFLNDGRLHADAKNHHAPPIATREVGRGHFELGQVQESIQALNHTGGDRKSDERRADPHAEPADVRNA